MIREIGINQGYSIGDMVHGGWIINKFVANTNAYDLVIDSEMKNKFLNALHAFYVPKEIISHCTKSFDLLDNGKLTANQTGYFIQLLDMYIHTCRKYYDNF